MCDMSLFTWLDKYFTNKWSRPLISYIQCDQCPPAAVDSKKKLSHEGITKIKVGRLFFSLKFWNWYQCSSYRTLGMFVCVQICEFSKENNEEWDENTKFDFFFVKILWQKCENRHIDEPFSYNKRQNKTNY